MIITFVHHIAGSIIGSFFTSNNVIDYRCERSPYDGFIRCDNYYISITGYINYAISIIKTKEINTTVKINFTDDPSNSSTSLLPLTLMSILTLLFAIILLITYIFYKNIYIKTFIYILLGLCLLFTCIILILVPSYIIKNATQSNCSSINIMTDFTGNRFNKCENSLNYAYITNVITSFLIICIFIYLYYYGFKTL